MTADMKFLRDELDRRGISGHQLADATGELPQNVNNWLSSTPKVWQFLRFLTRARRFLRISPSRWVTMLDSWTDEIYGPYETPKVEVRKAGRKAK